MLIDDPMLGSVTVAKSRCATRTFRTDRVWR